MTRENRKSCEPAKLLRSIDLPAFEPVAGTSLLWDSNTEDDSFPKATGAFFSFATALHEKLPNRADDCGLPPSGFIATSQNPDYGTFGRGAVVYGP